ncbi:efflux RND transporter periplasmic adaptor subunit [Acetobacter orleanensis]|nr:efflux RND transporter periplasmic adaptor subunit [Acetobacter orleanensis]
MLSPRRLFCPRCFVAISSFCLPFLLGACQKKVPSATSYVRVEVIHSQRTVTRGTAYWGQFIPHHVITLSFRHSGRVEALFVKTGDKVARGQPLAQLNQTDVIASAGEANGDLLVAKTALKGAYDTRARTSGLDRDGALSPFEVEQKRNAVDTAQGRMLTASARAQQFEADIRDGILRASENGTITQIVAYPGTVVTSGAPIMHMDSAQAEIRLKIPETAQVSEDVTLLPTADTAPPIKARLSRVAPDVDVATHLHDVFYTPDTPPDLPLNAGVTILTHALSQQVRIPRTSLVMGEGAQAALWLMTPDGGHVTRRTVTVVSLEGADAIVSDVSPNTPIVSVGATRLHEGEAVQPNYVRYR